MAAGVLALVGTPAMRPVHEWIRRLVVNRGMSVAWVVAGHVLRDLGFISRLSAEGEGCG